MQSSEQRAHATSEKLKLMVVDDEPDNLALLYRTFRREYEVYRAESGMVALEILDQEGEMAVIISDQRMPGMTGTEFLSRTVDRYPDTIRIVLTGYTDVEDLVEAINSGKVFKYITKPWDTDKLKAVVNQAGDTYRVIKQRTSELQRALRRESLLNAVMTAIRESLDYRSMLQRVVEAIGQAFEAKMAFLWPVEETRILDDLFTFQLGTALSQDDALAIVSESLRQAAIVDRKIQLAKASTQPSAYHQLAVPLVYQQDCIAILALCRAEELPWFSEDQRQIAGVAEQAALALSQAKLYQRSQEQAEQMRAELSVARQIQSNLLRQSWPEFQNIKIQACCYPAREVGGDFFEVFVHPQGDIWLSVGDVSGKGVPAALFMASTISVLRRELSQEVSPEPEVAMGNLNSILMDDLVSNNCFITMVLARYTPTTHQLVYANAGHIYPMVWSHQTIAALSGSPSSQKLPQPDYLKTRGVPLGILPIWKFQAGSLALREGDVFLLTSDGITEAQVSQNGAVAHPDSHPMLQQTGLWELLTQQPSPLNLDNLLARIRAYTQVQEDDQTILSLEVL